MMECNIARGGAPCPPPWLRACHTQGTCPGSNFFCWRIVYSIFELSVTKQLLDPAGYIIYIYVLHFVLEFSSTTFCYLTILTRETLPHRADLSTAPGPNPETVKLLNELVAGKTCQLSL